MHATTRRVQPSSERSMSQTQLFHHLTKPLHAELVHTSVQVEYRQLRTTLTSARHYLISRWRLVTYSYLQALQCQSAFPTPMSVCGPHSRPDNHVAAACITGIHATYLHIHHELFSTTRYIVAHASQVCTTRSKPMLQSPPE